MISSISDPKPLAATTMGKTALITGGTGLLGRQVIKAFQRKAWDVTGTGFTRATPPSILNLDLGSDAEVAKILNDVKYVHPPYSQAKLMV
jgi:nucleoside-diphosphate-sugar epimerase